MEFKVRDEAILAVIIDRKGEFSSVHIRTVVHEDRDLSIDALYSYLLEGMQEDNPEAITLLEVLTSVIEGLKIASPDFAASVRKMNYEYKKSKRNESDDSNT